MVNFNGNLFSETQQLLVKNRAFLFGDGVFETVKILDGKVLFLEDHYFRLMSGMRIVRMEIPMNFTMEYFEAQIIATAKASNCDGFSARKDYRLQGFRRLLSSRKKYGQLPYLQPAYQLEVV